MKTIKINQNLYFNEILILIRLFNQNKKIIKIIQIIQKTPRNTASLYSLYTTLSIYPLFGTRIGKPIQTLYSSFGTPFGTPIYIPIYPYIPIETLQPSWDAYRDTVQYPLSWDAYPDILYNTPKLGRVSGYTPPHPKI